MTRRGRGLIWLGLLIAGCQSARVPPVPAATALPGGDRLAAGFRYSVYGPEYNPGPEYWRGVGEKMAAKFPGAVPGAVWIVGHLKGQGSELSFPGHSENPLIQFTPSDENEATLALFDRAGIEAWLQVEPGNAPVEDLIHLMLERYGRHPCVVGVGVDVEWYRSVDEPEGQAVSDAEAAAWLAAARRHNPAYRLFVKHWLIEKMPPTLRDGLLFIDDSQILPSAEAMVDEFAAWGRAFAPAPVGFQIGYETDRPWWSKMADPPGELGRQILERIPNTRGIYWVDFTVLEVFPAADPTPEPRAAQPIVGMKIYELPANLDAMFADWVALGVDHAFTSEAVASDAAFRERADRAGVAVFVIAPVFQNPQAIARDPDLIAVTADGKPARDDWVAFVCPSRAAYRAQRVREIADLVRRLHARGVSLDFIRHFVFWEKVGIAAQHGDIPNACFCGYCVKAFAQKAGLTLPADLDPADAKAASAWILGQHEAQWTDWKTGLIDSMVAEIRDAMRAVDSAIQINLHAVPWRRFDYGGAVLRNAGQDFPALSKRVDYLSPMTYAHILGRPPDWVHSVVHRLSESSAAPVLPSIQVGEAYRPDAVFTVDEFTADLREALRPPSRGVIFWSWEAFVKEPEKLRAAATVLAGQRNRL
jgi:hypothetical protein